MQYNSRLNVHLGAAWLIDMKNLKIVLPLALLLSACATVFFSPIATDRTGYTDAWYYERLTPYYTNNIYFEPRVHLRAVQELVGIPITFADGAHGHADVWRQDIELFFAAPVPDMEDRIDLARRAIRLTCPLTDMAGVQDKVEYADQTYVVLQDVPCRGHAR